MSRAGVGTVGQPKAFWQNNHYPVELRVACKSVMGKIGRGRERNNLQGVALEMKAGM